MAWNAKNPEKWELYNMETDRTEMHDLAEELPEKVAEMKQMWNEWAERIGVQPWARILELKREKKNQ